MDVMLNDFSADGQFKDIDEFVESLSSDTLPALKMIQDNNNMVLWKTLDVYKRNICNKRKFGDVLGGYEIFGYAELSKFKMYLAQLTNDPFINDEWETDSNSNFDFSNSKMAELDGIEEIPNCITEAFTRHIPLLSFKHNLFSSHEINALVNNENATCFNLFNLESASFHFFNAEQITFGEFLANLKFDMKVSFFRNKNGDFYIDDGFINGKLSVKDGISLKNDLCEYLLDLKNGIINEKKTKPIEHKKKKYYEFRFTLSDQRIFRMFYIRDKEKIVFLNSHLKKTQKTPPIVKDESVHIINEYEKQKK